MSEHVEYMDKVENLTRLEIEETLRRLWGMTNSNLGTFIDKYYEENG